MTGSNGGAAWRLTKSKICLGAGLLGLFHEVVIHKGPERPYVLLAMLTLCGLASFMKLDDLLASRRFRITLDSPEDANTGRNGS